MRKELLDTGQTMLEPMLFFGNCVLTVEMQPTWNLHVMQEKFKKVSETVKNHFSEKADYRKIGKYKVKEVLAGEESLTSLLTQYVERTVAIRY